MTSNIVTWDMFHMLCPEHGFVYTYDGRCFICDEICTLINIPEDFDFGEED